MPGITRSYEMARRLVAAGHEVHMVTSDREPAAGTKAGWRETVEAGIRVHWLPVEYSNRMPYSARIRAFLKFSLAAAARAASIAGDVVFASSTPLTVAFPGVYASKRNGICMVFEVCDLWPELPIAVGALRNPVAIGVARWLERFAYRNAAYVVALSPGMKEGIVRAGYTPDRVRVIPNSCDFDLFEVPRERGEAFRRRYSWLQSRPLVVYVGTLGMMNGVTYLARLAAGVAKLDAEIRFLVVGSGKEEEQVRKAAADARVLEKSFFMLPPMPKSEVPVVLSAATVATSLFIDLKEMWANSANKFFDALAAGRPLAINYAGWQAELLEKHDVGIRLDPHDMEGAARKLVDFVRDKGRLSQAETAARCLGETRFSRDELARQLESVLLAAIEERGSKR